MYLWAQVLYFFGTKLDAVSSLVMHRPPFKMNVAEFAVRTEFVLQFVAIFHPDFKKKKKLSTWFI